MYPPMLPIEIVLILVGLLHVIENVFTYFHSHIILQRIDLFFGGMGELTKAEQTRRANAVKHKAALLLKECGVLGVNVPRTEGDNVETPKFLGTEVKRRCCVRKRSSPTSPSSSRAR